MGPASEFAEAVPPDTQLDDPEAADVQCCYGGTHPEYGAGDGDVDLGQQHEQEPGADEEASCGEKAVPGEFRDHCFEGETTESENPEQQVGETDYDEGATLTEMPEQQVGDTERLDYDEGATPTEIPEQHVGEAEQQVDEAEQQVDEAAFHTEVPVLGAYVFSTPSPKAWFRSPCSDDASKLQLDIIDLIVFMF